MKQYDYEEDYDYLDYEEAVTRSTPTKRKRGKRIGGIVYGIVILLLSIALIGALTYAIKANSNPSNGTIIQDNGTGMGTTDDPGMDKDSGTGDDTNGDGLNGSVEKPEDKEQEPLKSPSNLSTLRVNGMQMMSGASVYIGGDEALEPAMRFTCLVENSLVEQIENDSTKQAGMLMAPLDYFDAVNPNNYTYIDWIKEFDTAGKTYMLSLFEGYSKYDNDTSYVRFNLANVLYENINRKFVAIGVIITTNGNNVSYQYSAFDAGVDYRSNARSIAYVASAALNANALGLQPFDENKLAKLKRYVNMSVDYANGLEEPTNDNSTYALRITSGTTKTLSVGGTFTVQTEMTPNVEVPIWYRSSDTSILTVDDTGKVTALKAGTANVRILLAGVEHTVTVTVS